MWFEKNPHVPCRASLAESGTTRGASCSITVPFLKAISYSLLTTASTNGRGVSGVSVPPRRKDASRVKLSEYRFRRPIFFRPMMPSTSRSRSIESVALSVMPRSRAIVRTVKSGCSAT